MTSAQPDPAQTANSKATEVLQPGLERASQRPPRTHHYLPEFYLKQWCRTNGQLVRYTREYGTKVVDRRCSAGGSGHERDLYRVSVSNNDEWAAQRVEEEFFKPVDTAAERAMRRLLDDERPTWDSKSRSDWSRFLISLFVRSPLQLFDISQGLRQLSELDAPEVQSQYAARRKSTDPETFVQWQEQFAPDFFKDSARELLPDLIDNENIGKPINLMVWATLDLSRSDYSLLASDAGPIWASFNSPKGHIALPIGPTRLFIGAKDREFIRKLTWVQPTKVARYVNKLLVERARKQVIAQDETQSRFIQNRFGQAGTPTLPFSAESL